MLRPISLCRHAVATTPVGPPVRMSRSPEPGDSYSMSGTVTLPAGLNGTVCAVKRCRSSVGAIPTRQLSFQPVAIGAAVEVTILPKLLMERVA